MAPTTTPTAPTYEQLFAAADEIGQRIAAYDSPISGLNGGKDAGVQGLYLAEPEAYSAPYTIAVVAFIAHPIKGSTVADVVVANNGKPIGQRIRDVIANSPLLGGDWTVFDWNTVGEF